MSNHEDLLAATGGEPLLGSGFEDEQPDRRFTNETEPETKGKDQ